MHIQSNGRRRKKVKAGSLSPLTWQHMPEKCLACMQAKKNAVRELECDNSFAGVMIDRFGKEVSMIRLDDKRFAVNVEVAVGGQLLGMDHRSQER